MPVPNAPRHALAGLICLVLAMVVQGVAWADDTPVGSTQFGSTIFLDATHLEQSKNGKPGPLNEDGADLKRLCFSADHRFSDIWSAHLVTDINWTRNQSPTDLWVKHA